MTIDELPERPRHRLDGDEADLLVRSRGVTKRFGGLLAVNNVDFDIPRGSIVSLIGPNGAGKTTFFNMITGYYVPTTGEIIFDGSAIVRSGGRKVKALKPHEVTALGIGRTFQNIRLFGTMSALDNVRVGLNVHLKSHWWDAVVRTPGMLREEQKSIDEAMALLKLVDLDTRSETWARNLPYGDQRRLEIARALATRPKLLLLDEPTAGMNSSETREMTDFIRRLRAELGLTVLLIEHDMRVVMGISDRVTVLDHGEVIAEGIARRGAGQPEGHRGLSRPRRRRGVLTDGPARAQRRPHVLRRDPRPARRLVLRRRGRDRHAHRLERGRQVDDAADDLRPARAAPGRDQAPRRADRPPPAAPDRRAGRLPVARGPARLRADDASTRTSRWARSRARTRRPSPPTSSGSTGSSRGSRSATAQKAGTLSGGEQQMLAIGRALMAAPKVLLLDEPSMGLAPILVEQIFDIIREINAQGTTVLLVEQNALMALAIANRGYILQTGEIVLTDKAEALAKNPAVRAAYLGGD